MAGSTFGTLFKITTWGESHGPAVGVVIDGCPAGLSLTSEDIQLFLDRRRPGQNQFTTSRKEADAAQILSGVFKGCTTGAPISVMVKNEDPHSHDYEMLKNCYRPGHADYTFEAKYGIRDYRGGGRSSGRETIGRVAAGAVASRILSELGITLISFARSIGDVTVPESACHYDQIFENALYMPNNSYAQKASSYLQHCIKNRDSAGGMIECRVTGLPAGIGEPVFHKLDAALAGAVMSIGAVKGVEIGDGFASALSAGSANNDSFHMENGKPVKETNHSGGTLGGISDGSTLILRAAVKPTPSISREQKTVTCSGQDTAISITGRHDPVIVPRAVVVVEAMVAVTLTDLIMQNMSARLENIKEFYR
ncbi:MAG: chorismate synthase [Dorea sp.]|jgi:chorismate synthase|nr:chorismate synthase [Dorea sp.]